jgi:hypothetical protein
MRASAGQHEGCGSCGHRRSYASYLADSWRRCLSDTTTSPRPRPKPQPLQPAKLVGLKLQFAPPCHIEHTYIWSVSGTSKHCAAGCNPIHLAPSPLKEMAGQQRLAVQSFLRTRMPHDEETPFCSGSSMPDGYQELLKDPHRLNGRGAKHDMRVSGSQSSVSGKGAL